MLLPIKRILLEEFQLHIPKPGQMNSNQNNFSVATGALTPDQTSEHNQPDTKPMSHDFIINRHKYGFASKGAADHLHNNHLTAEKVGQYQNDIALIQSINAKGK